MKIAVICANGKAGKQIVKEAVSRGFGRNRCGSRRESDAGKACTEKRSV